MNSNCLLAVSLLTFMPSVGPLSMQQSISTRCPLAMWSLVICGCAQCMCFSASVVALGEGRCINEQIIHNAAMSQMFLWVIFLFDMYISNVGA
jgi:hypothetical protein